MIIKYKTSYDYCYYNILLNFINDDQQIQLKNNSSKVMHFPCLIILCSDILIVKLIP